MKKTAKTVLSQLGLLNVARKAKQAMPGHPQWRYRNVNTYRKELRGIALTFTTEDAYSKRWFYPRYDNGRYHEPATTNLFLDYVGATDCVLDIGANLGFFTCLAGKLASKGQVHAFEMDANCIPILNRNLEYNGLHNVVLNCCAVSNAAGAVRIPDRSEPNPGMRIMAGASQIRCREVPAIAIDDYVRKANIRPTFIKIDVEGAEIKVLEGMRECLKLPSLKLLVEVHVENLQHHFDAHYKDVLQMLIENGFLTTELVSHRDVNFERRKITLESQLEGNTMLFCTT